MPHIASISRRRRLFCVRLLLDLDSDSDLIYCFFFQFVTIIIITFEIFIIYGVIDDIFII